MKTDSTNANDELGAEIQEHLTNLGVETPRSSQALTVFTSKASKDSLAVHTRAMMEGLGLDMTDDSLAETPARVAKMWANELFWGLDYNNFPKATVVENKLDYDEMVLERDITVYSTCEHHLLPIIGNAYVAYIPGKTVLGLSKLNRIVEFFSRRPQIQERLTAQIFHALTYLLGTEDVAVCIAAEHMCVKVRGVEDACSDTVTSKLGGAFKSYGPARAEFFSLINLKKES